MTSVDGEYLASVPYSAARFRLDRKLRRFPRRWPPVTNTSQPGECRITAFVVGVEPVKACVHLPTTTRAESEHDDDLRIIAVTFSAQSTRAVSAAERQTRQVRQQRELTRKAWQDGRDQPRAGPANKTCDQPDIVEVCDSGSPQATRGVSVPESPAARQPTVPAFTAGDGGAFKARPASPRFAAVRSVSARQHQQRGVSAER